MTLDSTTEMPTAVDFLNQAGRQVEPFVTQLLKRAEGNTAQGMGAMIHLGSVAA